MDKGTLISDISVEVYQDKSINIQVFQTKVYVYYIYIYHYGLYTHAYLEQVVYQRKFEYKSTGIRICKNVVGIEKVYSDLQLYRYIGI